MRYPGVLSIDPMVRWTQRIQNADLSKIRGTTFAPQPPRGLLVQSSSRGFIISWSLPAKFDDIVAWRIYKDTEDSLYGELRDRGTRQYPIDATAGSSPTNVNVFVSSLNARGVESAKVQAQGKAITEAGAPTIPSVPGSFTGTNKSSGFTPRNGFTK